MKVIMHMPHVSLKVPKSFYKGLVISKNSFHKYNLQMTDLGIDELFNDYSCIKVKPKYSRLFCDVERFRDDKLEVMSKFGEGVVYTHTFDHTLFHVHDEKYKNKVLKYYDSYHKKLDKLTKKLLKQDNELLILDCHSYSEHMVSNFISEDESYPDICIGVEENYYDERILNLVIKKIKSLGFSYKINYPYKGSLVPNCVYNNEVKGKIVSIMLEINKKIYL